MGSFAIKWDEIEYAEHGKFQHIVTKAHTPVFNMLIHRIILRSFVADVDSQGSILNPQGIAVGVNNRTILHDPSLQRAS